MKELFDHYKEVREYRIKKEHFAVRDNGQVFRFPRVGTRSRLWDNQWTFGKINKQTGYLTVVSFPSTGLSLSHFTVRLQVLHTWSITLTLTNKTTDRKASAVDTTGKHLLNPISVKRIEYVTGVSILNSLRTRKNISTSSKKKILVGCDW